MRFFNRHLQDLETGTSNPNSNSTMCRKPPSSTSPIPSSPSTTDLPTYPLTNSNPSRTSTPRNSMTSNSELEKKLRELMADYDPKPRHLPTVFPMSEHRAMIRPMFLDNILWASTRLHKHEWIVESENEKFRDLCTTERWDQIHEDLDKYVKAIQNYEYWLTCMIQTVEMGPEQLPPGVETYGRTLAIIECAKHHNVDPEVTEALSINLVKSHQTWSRSNHFFRQIREQAKHKESARRNLIVRMWVATSSGGAMIIPMLIMVLDARVSVTLITTSVFTLGIGLLLAWWMEGANKKDIIAATAAYAAVLVVFVGSGTNL